MWLHVSACAQPIMWLHVLPLCIYNKQSKGAPTGAGSVVPTGSLVTSPGCWNHIIQEPFTGTVKYTQNKNLSFSVYFITIPAVSNKTNRTSYQPPDLHPAECKHWLR